MKKLLLIAVILTAQTSFADKTFYVSGKEASKVEAIKALLSNPKAQVTQCNQVELTDKVTLRNK